MQFLLVIKNPENRLIESILRTRGITFVSHVSRHYDCDTVIVEMDSKAKSENDCINQLNYWVGETMGVIPGIGYPQGALLFWNKNLFPKRQEEI
jgi:hypothetical protein